MRPQSEINAEIERLMPEREARVHRIEKTFAVCEDTAKREMEGNMTNPATQAAEAMREAAAKAIDNSICDVAENCEIFMYHRDYFVAIVRALPLPESAPDPQAATIARLSAELETASNSVLDALNHLDPIVHALGIEDSFKTPLEAIAEKDATIAQLSAELREAFDAGVEQGSDEATAYDWGAPSRLSRDEAFREYLRDQERRSRAVKET